MLRRALHAGHGVLTRDAWLWLGIATAVCAGATLYAVWALSDLSVQPGLAAVLSVMLAGIGLTGMCFHAIRVRASRRARAVPDEEIRIHVDISERFSQRR